MKPKKFKVIDDWNAATDKRTHEVAVPYDFESPNLTKSELFENQGRAIVGVVENIECAGDMKAIKQGLQDLKLGNVDFVLRVYDDKRQTLACPGADCPGKYKVGLSGDVSLITTVQGAYVIELMGKDSTGQTAVVRTWEIEALERDTVDYSNGPNGQGCGPGEMVDEYKFDNNFSCNCAGTKYVGENCDLEVNGNDDSESARQAWMVAIVLVVILSLGMVTGVAVYKYRLERIKMRAVDFSTVARQLQESGDMDIDASKSPREIKRRCVTKVKLLGEGAFGEVWKGILDESGEKNGRPE